VHVVVLNADRAEVRAAAEQLEAGLRAAGLEPLLDDRDEPAGVKFNDADLIGLPLRLTVSPRNLANGAVELRPRAGGETALVPLSTAVSAVASRLRAES
jgi:prolyl-tRNA synthetase